MMKKTKTDLRVLRTQNNITNAFIDLLEMKDFEDITVKDITTRGNMNRGTFYAHYLDKYDLMDKCKEELLNGMYEIISKNISEVVEKVDEQNDVSEPFSITVRMLEYINEQSRMMKILLVTNGDLSFQHKMKEIIFQLFNNNLGGGNFDKNTLVPSSYVISYIASANIGVIQEWLGRDKQESPEEIARIISAITVNGPLFALGVKK